MMWQEVRNDRFRGMGVHCYRYKRTAAVGREATSNVSARNCVQSAPQLAACAKLG